MSALTRVYPRPPYPIRVASTQINTNESAAAISGEPAAAEITIQTNNTGRTRSNGRLCLTRAGRTAGGRACGSARGGRGGGVVAGARGGAAPKRRPDGQVVGQHPQLGPGLGAVRGRRPLLEF